MKKILFFLLLSIISYNVFAQAPSKKCPTCGQSMGKCHYKGKHSKPTTPSKPAVSKPSSGTLNGHEWVDLGLSVKWATMNVGATSSSDYGGYYAWGETMQKTEYSWEMYKWCNGSYCSLTKYCTDSKYGTVDNKKNLDLSDDVARASWGGTWRMPTRNEMNELRTKCKWFWISNDQNKGYRVVGPNSNFIFLPASGYYYHNMDNITKLYSIEKEGKYLTSTLFDNYYSWYLSFSQKGVYEHIICRADGICVRPVTK